ncbi:translation elongation factor 4 [bacterium]|nr:translation elongation factor 4 [bacterium]
MSNYDKTMNNIRNFSIIAHIDHGKSTLADRLLEFTKTIDPKRMQEQVLDNMDLERERGITIKAHPIRMQYKAKDGQEYILNLIDTPGHVDFSYEVARSLDAVEGVLLVVDGSQGVEAQTVAHAYLAKEQQKVIIPIINKIDIETIDLDMVLAQVEVLIDKEPILASAKEGIGIEEILERIVLEIPPPLGEANKPTQALIFDSYFDPYKGVVLYIRVFNGRIKAGEIISLMSSGISYTVTEVGILRLGLFPAVCLFAGEVGYLCASIKKLADAQVGDTVTTAKNKTDIPIPGYKKLLPMVFASIYPADGGDFQELLDAAEKLRLNDSSFSFHKESSQALGQGLRCGFLGLLHMDIVQERLEREYELDLVLSSPSIPYKVYLRDGGCLEIENPVCFPDPASIIKCEEPYISATLIVPEDYLSNVLELIKERRGIKKDIRYLEGKRLILKYEIPLVEVVCDFYDRLKSCSCGFASLDYDYSEWRSLNLVKLDIILAGEVVDPLSALIRKEDAHRRGKNLAKKLKEVIPKGQFAISIQAAIGKNVIARETIPSVRKDVTAKCYGGDITRKRKLLEKQKMGKKRMKRFGKIDLPQQAFQAILSS